MKTYILVATALLFGAVALPTPASALNCMPINTGDLVNEVRCLSGIDTLRCNGDLSDECAEVVRTAGWVFDTADGLSKKFHPGVSIILP